MNFERIKKTRELSNLKQSDIASILGVDRTTYTSYELGRDIIPIERLNTFVNYFNISIDYIFEFTNNLNYNNSVKELDVKLIGNRLKDTRIELKKTQDYIAKLLNTNHSVWCRYEQGKFMISTIFLYTICKKYNISADYLLGKIDEPKYLK